MNRSRSSLPAWIVAASAVAAVALAVVHERREERRCAELVQRIDEIRLLSTMGRDAGGLRALASASSDDLARRVAQAVLAAQGGRAAATATGAAPRVEPPAAAEPPPPTPEQQSLVAQAEQIGERALGSGTLHRSDVLALRDLFGRAGAGSGAEQRQLRDRIVQAINDQKLAVEDPAFVLF